MNILKIKKLIEIIEKSNISKIRISKNKETISITRKIIFKNYNNKRNAFKNNKINKNTENKIKQKTKKQHIIKSPLVGTFYRSSSPGLKPLIEKGQKIQSGDPLCIIESMKIMNQIESDITGIIKSILVQNGKPVEFNEPLIIIEKLENSNV